MKKFFESGGFFMIVALICVVAGVVSEKGNIFISLGAFWMIVAVIVRARNAKKSAGDGDDGAS